MEDRHILSIDPGKSSGVALGHIGRNAPYSLLNRWQIGGGVKGLIEWIDLWGEVGTGVQPYFEFYELGDEDGTPLYVTDFVCEKFVPLSGGGFHQTLGSVEPLRGEGALVALNIMPDYPHENWRRANEQYLFGGSDKAEKRKRAKAYLKSQGMYITGKDVGRPDAEDAISAILHGISYAAKVLKHRPTFEAISKWSAENQ